MDFVPGLFGPFKLSTWSQETEVYNFCYIAGILYLSFVAVMLGFLIKVSFAVYRLNKYLNDEDPYFDPTCSNLTCYISCLVHYVSVLKKSIKISQTLVLTTRFQGFLFLFGLQYAGAVTYSNRSAHYQGALWFGIQITQT